MVEPWVDMPVLPQLVVEQVEEEQAVLEVLFHVLLKLQDLVEMVCHQALMELQP